MRWLLCNPAYIGTKEVNKKKRNLDQSKLPENQRYRIVDANWPPIVSKETFEKVQLLLGENLRSGHNRADTKRHVYMLQGLVVCGKCTGPMEGRSGTGRLGEKHYYYVCRSRDCGFRVAEKELLRVVLGRIGRIARSPRLLGSLVAATNETLQSEVPALQARKATLDREVDEIKGQTDRLLDGVGLEGSDGEVFFKEKLSELGKRRSGLETTIVELEMTIDQIKRNAVNQEGVLASLAKFRSMYQALPPYQQREGIRLVIANVRISEDALEISIHGRPAPEEVLEKLRAPGMHAPRRSERSTWLRTRSAGRTVLRSETENFNSFSGRNCL
jgi:Recombinase/Recombinase zinc beta ribbon domain